MSGNTAVFDPACCLTFDQSRLTKMNLEALKCATEEILAGRASLIIISTAYDIWEKERDLKLAILARLGIDAGSIEVIENVADSYEEARKIIEILKRRKTDTLIVVGEKEQEPRTARAIRKERDKANLVCVLIDQTFVASKFERTYEPHPIKVLGWVKSVRAGNRTLWRLWNWLFGLIS